MREDIRKEDLHELVEHLNKEDLKTGYDFLKYLVERSKDPFAWAKDLDADPYPMNEEERAQWESKDKEYISLDDAAKMLGVNLKKKK